MIKDSFLADSLKFSFIYFEYLSEEDRVGMSGRKCKKSGRHQLVKGY